MTRGVQAEARRLAQGLGREPSFGEEGVHVVAWNDQLDATVATLARKHTSSELRAAAGEPWDNDAPLWHFLLVMAASARERSGR